MKVAIHEFFPAVFAPFQGRAVKSASDGNNPDSSQAISFDAVASGKAEPDSAQGADRFAHGAQPVEPDEVSA